MNEKLVKISGYTHKQLVELKEKARKEEKRDSIGLIVERLVDNEYRRISQES